MITIYPCRPTRSIFWSFMPEAMTALDQIGGFIRNLTGALANPAAGQD
jgi:hypothetical protein